MTPIRAIIAEDEPASRQRLRSLLARARDVQIVAECTTGTETIASLKRLRPSVVFLDIQMPGHDGFQVLRALPLSHLPVVVFVTAYDRYAVRAFEVHAIDYLLKPFDDERFERALECVREHLRTRRTLADLQERLHVLLQRNEDASTASPRSPARLPLSVEGELAFVPLPTITHVTAEGSYIRVHTVSRSYLVRESLAGVERRLPVGHFIRVGRSAIVNLDAVDALEPLSHADGRLRLSTGESVKVSRRYRSIVLPRLQSPHARRSPNRSSE